MRTTPFFLLVSLLSTAGCSDSDSDLDLDGDSDDASVSASSGGGDEPETMGMPNFLACDDENDLESRGQFAGPLFDSETSTIVGEVLPSYIAATTLFNFRNDVRAEFERVVDEVIVQAIVSPGFVGYELAYSEGCQYGRTITVWESESAMMDFMLSGAHADAITRVRELGNDGRTIDWEVQAADLPISWETAREQLAPVLP